MGMIKDLTEAEDIKKRWQDYTEELYKKELNVPDNHDGVVTDLEPDILECEVKWALGSLANNKASGGIIDFLVSPHPIAKVLRDHLVFKIAPMLNPDGVYLGNYRCSLMGFDLNRHWVDPSPWAHPTLHGVKQLIVQMYNNPKFISLLTKWVSFYTTRLPYIDTLPKVSKDAVTVLKLT
ncbi:Cytosolic carboxypeptidase 6, partial [Varanus komodoensis]